MTAPVEDVGVNPDELIVGDVMAVESFAQVADRHHEAFHGQLNSPRRCRTRRCKESSSGLIRLIGDVGGGKSGELPVMDAGAAAVLAATVAGLASAIGVTTSALITGRTAVVQAVEASRTERAKLDAERAQHAFEARREDYANFYAVLVTAVQKTIALAEGPRTLVADTTPTTDETRKAIREVRMSLHKNVLMLGNVDVAALAQSAVQELERTFRAACDLAASDRAEEGVAALVWEDRSTCLEERLQTLALSMGKAMFPPAPS
ncbi:hypothetical protein ACFUIZ_34625 [Streptomyces cinereoruber]|uniref:hypothetical protein n=1 Tax=Streptomyces cinereoruber TaxID=67260 RepID=UPI003627E9C5